MSLFDVERWYSWIPEFTFETHILDLSEAEGTAIKHKFSEQMLKRQNSMSSQDEYASGCFWTQQKPEKRSKIWRDGWKRSYQNTGLKNLLCLSVFRQEGKVWQISILILCAVPKMRHNTQIILPLESFWQRSL
jgi:hypothetical protein